MNRKEKVLAFLRHEAAVPLSPEEIAAILCVPPKDHAALLEILEALTQKGQVQCHKGRYAAKKTFSDAAMLESILRAHGFSAEFPAPVQDMAEKIPDRVEDITNRRDLRSLLTFTIDGADARDFDDALSIEETPAGFRLYVHIADVSHYVKYGTAIDKEAYARGTSCYLPNRAIPMLPSSLSCGICSLNPGVDRLSLTTIMELDRDGRLLSHEIAEAVIRSDFRLVYETVSDWLLKGKADKEHSRVYPALSLLYTLSQLLTLRRREKGSIDFNLPEPQIVMDADGQAVDIRPRADGAANRMIENAMVLCNEVLASHALRLGVPFIYRVHQAPDKEKLEQLTDALLPLGLSIPGKFSGKKATALLEKISGSPEEYVVSTLLLRAMMKAKYSHENIGHFGLGIEDYCHFTSPIRRYPDLFCHRVIKATLHGGNLQKLERMARRTALFSSDREEAAAEAEREALRYYMCRCMESRIGEIFTATISSVTDFGLFVMLPNLSEGLVHVRELGEDYYIFDAKTLSLTGKRSGRVYRLGQTLSVELVRVDSALSRMDFVIKEELSHGKNNRAKQKSKT